MKFIFFGTPKEATIVLATLKESGYVPSLIVTAPDRPSGRGLHIEESPVAVWAKDNTIPTFKPESLKNTAAIEKIKAEEPDLCIVFAYGKIIPQSILSLPKHSTLNIHPSLLPLHRGPSPVEGAILSGDQETGVSIMVLDSEMDHGPIIAQEKLEIGEDETAAELLEKLVSIGARKLSELLPDYISGKIETAKQYHSKATYTKKISRADGEISLSDDPEELYRKYRAYLGWPGIYFFDRPSDEPNNNKPDGTSAKIRISIKKARMEDGIFLIERIVPEGKKEIDYADYLRAKKA